MVNILSYQWTRNLIVKKPKISSEISQSNLFQLTDMRFRSTCMYKRQENIKVDYSIIRSRPLTHQITIYDSRFTSTVQFTIMASAQIINCITCKEPVRPRQQGLQCDGCFRWNHRVCNTGISLEVYNNSEISARRLLKLCSYVNGPTTRC